MPTQLQRLILRERPATRPVMRQSWKELLFLHWRYEAAELQKLLPPGLTIDTFDGSGWLGVVPFFMAGVRPAWLPAIPGISDFLELNVRTYVFDEKGDPGVWFFSLDASSRLAVWGARTFFKLPYHYSRMRARATPATVDYWAQRPGLEPNHYAWQPFGPEREAEPNSLDFFILERYLLFSYDSKTGRIFRGRVHHTPYRFQDVRILEHTTQLLKPAGLQVSSSFQHAAAVRNVDVTIFGLVR